MDVMMKILLPACFIALKLTGTFIDFMLGLSNSNVQEDTEIPTAQVTDSRIIWYDSYHIENLVLRYIYREALNQKFWNYLIYIEILAQRILIFQKALIHWRHGLVIQLSKVSGSGHA